MEKPKKRYVEYDEAPSGITDHAFEPDGAWYTRCKHCHMAEAAHAETTIDVFAEIMADHDRQKSRRKHREESRKARIGYFSDDDPYEE